MPKVQVKEKNREFQPYLGKIRKSGTGCIYEVYKGLYQGSYNPTNAEGKRERHFVYAKTREECEEKLSAMIPEIKERIKKEKKRREKEKTTEQ